MYFDKCTLQKIVYPVFFGTNKLLLLLLLKVPGSSPTDTTIFSILCTEKGFFVSQLDVIQKQKLTDEMNADKKSFIELPSNPMEHFFRCLNHQKSNLLFSKRREKF